MNRKKTNVTYLEDIKTEPQPEIMRFRRDLLKNHMGKIRSWKDEIYKEMKDFHSRLCVLEEKLKEK